MDNGHAGCITFHYLQFGRALDNPFTTTNNSFFLMPECGTARHPVSPVQEWTKIPMLEPVRYRNALVPVWDTGCRYADAGGIDLDADAQLWNCLHHRGLSWTWTCFHFRVICCTWTCQQNRGLSCTWAFLDSLCWSGHVYTLHHMGLSCLWKITEFREILYKYAVRNSAKFRGILGNSSRNTEVTEVQKTYGILCRRNSVNTLHTVPPTKI